MNQKIYINHYRCQQPKGSPPGENRASKTSPAPFCRSQWVASYSNPKFWWFCPRSCLWWCPSWGRKSQRRRCGRVRRANRAPRLCRLRISKASPFCRQLPRRSCSESGGNSTNWHPCHALPKRTSARHRSHCRSRSASSLRLRCTFCGGSRSPRDGGFGPRSMKRWDPWMGGTGRTSHSENARWGSKSESGIGSSKCGWFGRRRNLRPTGAKSQLKGDLKKVSQTSWWK